MNKLLILGSASPRRRVILGEMDISFEILVPDVDEVFLENAPEETSRRNALLKNEWCRKRLQDRTILTADTIVALDGRCYSKPESMDEAREFLRALSGRLHTVFTSVALSAPDRGVRLEVVPSGVLFKRLTEDIIDEYFSKLDPMDRAGAYDVDEHGDMIIESIDGSYTNVMGLPREKVKEMLDCLTGEI